MMRYIFAALLIFSAGACFGYIVCAYSVLRGGLK